MSLELLLNDQNINSYNKINVVLDEELPADTYLKTYDKKDKVIIAEYKELNYKFVFDNLFTEKDSTQEIFNECFLQVLKETISGQNGLMLLYGDFNKEQIESFYANTFNYLTSATDFTACRVSERLLLGRIWNEEEILYKDMEKNPSCEFISYHNSHMYIVKLYYEEKEAATLYLINISADKNNTTEETLFKSNAYFTEEANEIEQQITPLYLIKHFIDAAVNKSILINLSPYACTVSQSLNKLISVRNLLSAENEYHGIIKITNNITERLNSEVNNLVKNYYSLNDICDLLFTEDENSKSSIQHLQLKADIQNIIQDFKIKALKEISEIEESYKESLRRNNEDYKINVERLFNSLKERDDKIALLENENVLLKEEIRNINNKFNDASGNPLMRTNLVENSKAYNVNNSDLYGLLHYEQLLCDNKKLQESLIYKGTYSLILEYFVEEFQSQIIKLNKATKELRLIISSQEESESQYKLKELPINYSSSNSINSQEEFEIVTQQFEIIAKPIITKLSSPKESQFALKGLGMEFENKTLELKFSPKSKVESLNNDTEKQSASIYLSAQSLSLSSSSHFSPFTTPLNTNTQSFKLEQESKDLHRHNSNVSKKGFYGLETTNSKMEKDSTIFKKCYDNNDNSKMNALEELMSSFEKNRFMLTSLAEMIANINSGVEVTEDDILNIKYYGLESFIRKIKESVFTLSINNMKCLKLNNTTNSAIIDNYNAYVGSYNKVIQSILYSSSKNVQVLLGTVKLLLREYMKMLGCMHLGSMNNVIAY
jgi:hypothetical protein